jgi:hypothetical protein
MLSLHRGLDGGQPEPAVGVIGRDHLAPEGFVLLARPGADGDRGADRTLADGIFPR